MDVIETAQARPGVAAHSCAGESVASKIMRLLDAVRDDGTGLGPSEVARRSGLPYATVHRLLTELVRVGALQHDDCGRYSIGLRLWEIGASTPSLIRLRTVALPHLQSLAAAGPSRAAHLDVLDNGRGLRLEQMSSRQAVLAAGDAATFPLHATSGGQVLLAHSATAVVDHLLAQPLLRFTPRTVTVPDHLRVVLAGVRRVGVAISDGAYRPGQVDIAAPVFGAEGAVVASIELVLPAGTDPRQHVAAVRSAAAALTARLRSGQRQPTAKAASKAAAGGSNIRSATN
jgi:DNA-binding IclR family transcriptional regulator